MLQMLRRKDLSSARQRSRRAGTTPGVAVSRRPAGS
jgi:hypothetical protein